MQKQDQKLKGSDAYRVISRWLAVVALASAAPVFAGGNTGSGGVGHVSTSGSGAPTVQASKGGTAGTSQALMQPASGFNCPPGESWGFQDGVLKCVKPGGGASNALKGKVVFVRAKLISEFVTGRLLRITGTGVDLRLDALDLNNQVVSTCFLNDPAKVCHMGLPGGTNTNLDKEPFLPSRDITEKQFFIFGADARTFVSKQLVYAGSVSGGPLQDHFVLSAWQEAQGLVFNVVGLYSGLSNSPTQALTLTPVISTGKISLTQLGFAKDGEVFTLPNAWAAPLPPGPPAN